MLVTVPNATEFPYRDAVTGSEKGPFIDTGIIMPFDHSEGAARRVYLSLDTVREMAQMLGLVNDPDVAKKAITEAYNQGMLDAVKEGLDGDVRRVADRLGAVAQYLAGDVAAS